MCLKRPSYGSRVYCPLQSLLVRGAQATYTALTKSFQNEWTFHLHVILGCDNAFRNLESTLFSDILPILFGCEITPSERKLLSLPTRFGSLDIVDP